MKALDNGRQLVFNEYRLYEELLTALEYSLTEKGSTLLSHMSGMVSLMINFASSFVFASLTFFLSFPVSFIICFLSVKAITCKPDRVIARFDTLLYNTSFSSVLISFPTCHRSK